MTCTNNHSSEKVWCLLVLLILVLIGWARCEEQYSMTVGDSVMNFTRILGYDPTSAFADGNVLCFPRSIFNRTQDGAIFVADTGNHRIKRRDANGKVITIAGNGYSGYNGDNILATKAQLNYPQSVFVHTNGEIYIADTNNHRIRKIGLNGIITTIAGNGISGYNGDNILATGAQLHYPKSVFVYGFGEVYLSDSGNHRIRKIGLNGIITTIAGNGISGYNGDNIFATKAQLNYPQSVFVHTNGEIYIADSSNGVRKVDKYGIITTSILTSYTLQSSLILTFTSTSNFVPVYVFNNEIYFVDNGFRKINLEGPVVQPPPTIPITNSLYSHLYSSFCLFVHNGDIYFCYSDDIRKIGLNGIITNIAGNGISGYNGDNILATKAQLNYPQSVFVHTNGEIYIADTNNHRIRKIGLNGIITTIAGNGISGYNGDNILATKAQLNYPQSVFVYTNGEIYIADTNNHRIRKIGLNGIITTIAGNGISGYNGDNILATKAQLNYLQSVFVYTNGEIYIADTNNHRIRKIGLNGIITTIAGDGEGWYKNGFTQFYVPKSIFVVNNTEIYVSNDITIRKLVYATDEIISQVQISQKNTLVYSVHQDVQQNDIARSSKVVTQEKTIYSNMNGSTYIYANNDSMLVSDTYSIKSVIGNRTSEAIIGNNFANNICLQQRINQVFSIGKSLYYVEDNMFVRKKEGSNVITIVQLSYPFIFVHTNSEIYIADVNYNGIRKIGLNGQLTNLTSCTLAGYNGDNILAKNAQLNYPKSVFVHTNGEIYIADTGNHRIRKIGLNGNIITIAGNGTSGYNGDNMLAKNAQLNYPKSVFVHTNGEIYIADTGNHRIRKIGLNGNITTIAGNGISGYNGDNILATNAQLNNPQSLSVHRNGDVYFSDSKSDRIRKIDLNGVISTILSSSIPFHIDNSGRLFVALQNPSIILQLNSCLPGYFGENCTFFTCGEIEPSDISVCNKRGNCIAGNTCKCNSKSTGKLCERCLPGFGGDLCDAYVCGGVLSTNSTVCNGRGKCIRPNLCNCSSTSTGNFCESCLPGFGGDLCDTYVCGGVLATNSTVCNGRGKCIGPNLCNCSSTSTDDFCESCLPGYGGNLCDTYVCGGVLATNSTVCNGHGKCAGPNLCNCLNGYSGVNCEIVSCFNITQTSPNVCSSNGKCVGFNQCSCSPDYSGPECQYLSCFGIPMSDPNICSGKGYCSSPPSLCVCNSGFSGDDCSEIFCYGTSSKNPTVCNGRGQCISPNQCECKEGSSGSECEQTYCFGVLSTSENVCSRHGNCFLPNNCTCNNGFYGPNCEYVQCFGIMANSSSVCSGHGSCVGVDKCLCNNGYVGHNCQFPICSGIPSNHSDVCRGRGNCVDFDMCNCTSGYIGIDCQHSICFSVSSNESELVCSGHGSCVKPDMCECRTGYYGTNCEIYSCANILPNDTAVCSSHGKCIGLNMCNCSYGWSGVTCQNTACFGIDPYDRSVCNGHGACTSKDTCICQSSYSGSKCEFPVCFGISSNNPSTCSGRGNCIQPNKCECSQGYTGTKCEYPLCFKLASSSNLVCNGHGTCDGPDNCKCNTGYTNVQCDIPICSGIRADNSTVCSNGQGVCKSPDACQCIDGYTGPNCEYPICNNIPSNSKSVCGGKGDCIAPDYCKCFGGYEGNVCQMFSCGKCPVHSTCIEPIGCECDDGYAGKNCEPSCNGIVASNYSDVCNGYGNCIAPEVCQCTTTKYSGTYCKDPICFEIDSSDRSVCSGKGDCLKPDTCNCKTGYGGKKCEFTVCGSILASNITVCSGHGTCIGPNNCKCKPGYEGNTCERFVCKNCPAQSHCVDPHGCVCLAGYTGDECDIPFCNGIVATNSSVCGGRGKCISHNLCSCPSGYGGRDCNDISCSGILKSNQSFVCNGRGECIGPNNCSCANAWTGSNCEIPNCFGLSAKSFSVCNGHGICISPDLCECSSIYSGLECEFPKCFGIESNSSLTCSGNGQCVGPNTCICNQGFNGEKCDIHTCFSIDFTNTSNVCNGNGVCKALDICVCESGKFEGVDCLVPICFGNLANDSQVCNGQGNCSDPNICQCNNQYSGKDCSNPHCFGVPSIDPQACSGNGHCVNPDTCICSPSYYGLKCEYPVCFGIKSDNSTVCNGHGDCLNPNVCSCTNDYAGNQCQYPKCFEYSSINTLVCSGHGNCTSPNQCSCKYGYKGDMCEFHTCFGLMPSEEKVCNRRGVCAGVDKCKCFNNEYAGNECQYPTCNGTSSDKYQVCNGHGNCTAKDECQCSTGFSGKYCQYPQCFGLASDNKMVCDSRGVCTAPDKCSCNEGYQGFKCQYPVCNGTTTESGACNFNGICIEKEKCNCNFGYDGQYCQYPVCNSILSNNPIVCNSHGDCISPDNCKCNGYQGKFCKYPVCFGYSLALNNSVCSGNGECVAPDSCVCKHGYRGEFCQHSVCFGIDSNSTEVCNYRNGSCVEPDKCKCNEGYFGLNCQNFTCFNIKPEDSNACNGNGTCILYNTCQCKEGYSGEKCQFGGILVVNLGGSEKAEFYGENVHVSNAIMNRPSSLLSQDGCVYFADTNNHRIRKIDENGIITTIAGTDRSGYNGDNFKAIEASLNYPIGIFVFEGEIYVADSKNHKIRKIDKNGIISTIAGDTPGQESDNYLAIDTQLRSPKDVFVHPTTKDIYFADSLNHKVRRIDNQNIIRNVVGTGKSGYNQDSGLASQTMLSSPVSIHIIDNTLFIVDQGNSLIRKVDLSNEKLTTVAGKYETRRRSLKKRGSRINLTTKATEMVLTKPTSILATSSDEFYFSDADGLMRVRSSGVITKVASVFAKGIAIQNDSSTGEHIVVTENNYIRKIRSDITCFGKNQFDPLVCSGVGNCFDNDKCICLEGRYTGYECQLPICFGINSSLTQDVCHGNGECIKPDECKCNTKLVNTGSKCAQCFNSPSVQCSNQGVCVEKDKCDCYDGFGGNNCELFICNGTLSSHPSACNGNGECVGSNKCKCKDEINFDPLNYCKIDTTPNAVLTDSTAATVSYIIFPILTILFIVLVIIIIIIIQRRAQHRRKKVEKDIERKMNDMYFKDYSVELLSERGDNDSSESSLSPYIIPIEDIEFVKRIGAGGFGTVFKAKWKEVIVAAKAINDSEDNNMDEFEKEASLMYSLKHPNILTCYGISVSDSKKLMIVEYLENGSLEKVIADLRNGSITMSLKQKLNFLLDISNGLQYLHNLKPNPIIHRDLKPGNILLDKNNRCKICDFGLSRIVSTKSANNLTSHVGSYFYMANEMLSDDDSLLQKQYATAIDVYSFGILTWELIFEDNPYFYSNVKKLFFDSSFENSEYCKLSGYNIPIKVSHGLRPVIPFTLDTLIEWCDKFMIHKDDVAKKNSVCHIMNGLKEMMKECWHENPSFRPSFTDIVKRLQLFKLSFEK